MTSETVPPGQNDISSLDYNCEKAKHFSSIYYDEIMRLKIDDSFVGNQMPVRTLKSCKHSELTIPLNVTNAKKNTMEIICKTQTIVR